jgi:hypothetical protein
MIDLVTVDLVYNGWFAPDLLDEKYCESYHFLSCFFGHCNKKIDEMKDKGQTLLVCSSKK